jgi:hypothetical protein
MDIRQHEEIIMEALQDYRKRFEDEPDKQQEIDLAINSLNQNKEFFPITFVCKDDIRHAFGDDAQAQKIIIKMDDGDMETLASKLADDYCDQLYWDSLKVIVEMVFM